MTSTSGPPARRAPLALLDVAVRAPGLVVATSLLTAASGLADSLAGGLLEFFLLATLTLVLALLDGLLQRDRVRLRLVSALLVPTVVLLEMVVDLHRVLTGPGAYPSLELALDASWPDLVGSLVLYGALVSVPAAWGHGISVALRALASAASTRPAAEGPRTGRRAGRPA